MSTTVAVDYRLCRGHGICTLLLADRLELDRWGFPIVDDRPVDTPALEQRARRAIAACPRGALSLRD
ncbi:MAG: ferredoxin [Acidimicrobiales bacterium]